MLTRKRISVVVADTILELRNAAEQFGSDSVERQLLIEGGDPLYKKVQQRCAVRWGEKPDLDDVQTIVDEMLEPERKVADEEFNKSLGTGYDKI